MKMTAKIETLRPQHYELFNPLQAKQVMELQGFNNKLAEAAEKSRQDHNKRKQGYEEPHQGRRD